MSNEAYSRLIKALTAAGINCYGENPLVPYEDLITREDVFFAHAIHLRLD